MAHREDIQGLRAVAVLLVALGHAGVPFLNGGYVGVDVFFVLSGYLITGVLLAEAERRGRVSLAGFYVRRARRILPAAALTLVVTDVVAHHLLNFVRARDAVDDSIWASVFAANVHFARIGSDYFAQGVPPSPVLHFWTLSVEEQFYLVWPTVLALALLWFAARALRRTLLAVVCVAGALSLAWSIYDTATSATAAYYSTFARAWELALGAGLALAATRVAQVPAQARLVAGWLGLAAVGCAGVLLDTATPFPGYAALLPTVGAALVIGAGIAREQRRFEARRVLSLRPLRYVGDRSYAFYLWHWPVLILAIEHEGHDFSVGVKLLLLAGAFTLSIVSYALWEDPIRRLRWPARTGGLLWPASAVVVLAVALPILGSLDKAAARVDAASAAVKPAALVDVSATYTPQAELQAVAAVRAAVRAARRNRPLPSKMTPPVGRLRGDFYELPNECTPGRKDTQPKKICRLGAKKSSKKIVVIGDSHAQMWMRPIVQMAKKDRWVVIPLIKVSCIPRTWKSNGVCGGWLQWAKKKASRMHPGVTLVIGSWMATYGPDRAIRPVDSLTSAMLRSSASVVVLGDLPGQTRDPTDCLLARGSTMRTCSTETKPVQLRVNRAIAANTRRRGAGFIDPLRWFCGHTRGGGNLLCPLVVNKTITCVDRGHISKTYAGELNAAFRSAFRRELFR